MPEGPETHYIADRARQMLAGQPLVTVQFSLPGLKPYEKRLKGRCVVDVQARGKALLTSFDNGLTLYTHSQLLGYWEFQAKSPPDPPTGSPRVWLATRSGAASLHIAPKVEMWKTSAIETHPFLSKLGPDVLGSGVTAGEFVERVSTPPFARRKLAALLLQQEFAAGMGNYLRSEVLYEARLAPLRTGASLEPKEARALAKALLAVSRRSYRSKFKGALPDSSKDYLAQTAKTFRFKVFEREGEPCPSCGGRIVMERIVSRRLYWCQRCQQ
ncbi:MAG: endonuclease VIII [Pseudoxanthomonas sp.]